MKYTIIAASLLFPLLAGANISTDLVKKTYSKSAREVEGLYQHFHRFPELSKREFKTAKKMAAELKKLGIKTTEKIGGTGVVGVYKNGPGPTIWLRADMDALPIKENTKKKYASQVDGVMHACGHDTHIATLIGYAKSLIELKNKWSGTLVFLVQPAEETGTGALAMIKDGLYKKFPKPDYVLGLHVSGKHDSGVIAYTPGFALAAVDAIDIEVKGSGGHGSTPHETIDPVMLASKIIVNTQTLVSRNVDTRDPVVLTYGSIHGGTKHNIIPDGVKLQATLRTYSAKARKTMKSGLTRMVKALAKAEGAPEPTIKFTEPLPPTFNNIKLTQRMVPIFEKVVGKKKVVEEKGIMGAEDFSHYGQNDKYPAFIFFIGGAPKNKSHYGMNHNAKFAPEYKKVLQVGVEVITHAVAELAPSKSSASR